MEELGGAPNVLGAALLGKWGEKLEGKEKWRGGRPNEVFGEEREEWEGKN